MKKIYLLFLISLILFVAGCSSGKQPNTQVAMSSNTRTIEISSFGFSPNLLTIKKGDTVTWISKDSAEHWPASAMHPTHTVYPSSDIKKCGTSKEKNIFDACYGLKQDESWSFTFNEKGTWSYHDHLDPKLYGKIIVE